MRMYARLGCVVGCLVALILHCAAIAQPKGPATPPSPVQAPTAPLVDVEKLDKESCTKYRANPIVCPVGQPQCEINKKAVEVKCNDLLPVSWIDLEKIFNTIRDRTTEVVLLVISLFFAGLAAWLKLQFDRLKDKTGALALRVLDPFFPRPPLFDQYATNLILIGEGGSGKTTLIHALSGANEAKPDVATASLSTYTLVNEVSIESGGKLTRRLVRMYADDYVGQNWVQGTTNDRLKGRQAIVKSSTLVVVVDVVESGQADTVERLDKHQAARVREHVISYNDQAIQTLTSLMGTNAQVVLFINKMDLIYPLTDEAEAAVKQAFHPIIERLRHLRGIELHVILGSAATGSGVVGYDFGNKKDRSLYKIVIDHAEKIDSALLEAMNNGRSSQSP